METVIVICLLTVIGLLLHDKVSIQKAHPKRGKPQGEPATLPDIMGEPKPEKSHRPPSGDREGPKGKALPGGASFDPEADIEGFDRIVPQEEPDETGGPDLEEEEREWEGYGEPNGEDEGFATGVTFEELATVGMVLRQVEPEPSLQKQAVAIVQKIQGTELFSLLENSIEGSSKRIAELLDGSLPAGTDPGSSIMRNDNLNDFDIGEFV